MYCIPGSSFKQVVDHCCYKKFAVDLVKMDDTLICIDHILKVGYFRCYECEIVIIVVVLVSGRAPEGIPDRSQP